MSDVSKQLEQKKEDLSGWHEKKKQNEQLFHEQVGDKKEIYSALLKIFNKSVKKKKVCVFLSMALGCRFWGGACAHACACCVAVGGAEARASGGRW
jgi:hypothetical protein